MKMVGSRWVTFKANTRLEVINRRMVIFCHDMCCDDIPLKDYFSSYLLLLIVRRLRWIMIGSFEGSTLAYKEIGYISNVSIIMAI